MVLENKSILLAEDNLVNQKLALMLLGQLGLKADVVDNGRKALEAATSSLYTVILMDCQMPEMDGFEATKAIRKVEAQRGSYTPIIAVTALAMVGDRERCIAAGMDDYISKPIDREILKIKLNHWMKNESVSRNQQLASAVGSTVSSRTGEKAPINIAELSEFYGSTELDDVLAAFVSTTAQLLQEMEELIAAHKDIELANKAHELKGASASVGAKGLAKLGLYLERAAGMSDWNEARDTFSALQESFREVKEFIIQQTKISSLK